MYSIGTRIQIGVNEYRVDGWIGYRDADDGSTWDEYLLRSKNGESWLTCEPGKPMELSAESKSRNIPEGFTLVESGKQICTGSKGPVDTDPGESARYEDYSDGAGHTFTIEYWGVQTEYSNGIMVDPEDFSVLSEGKTSDVPPRPDFSSMSAEGLWERYGRIISMIIGVVLVLGSTFACSGYSSDIYKTAVKSYIDGNTELYKPVTYVSGLHDNKAYVYSSTASVNETAMAIIKSQDGNFEKVQSSDAGDSVAMLSSNEYCLVYKASSEDAADSQEQDGARSESPETAIEDGTTLVEVASRAYAFENDSAPYHTSRLNYLFWRNFYWSFGYSKDKDRYTNIASPYTNNGGETIAANPSDAYSGYSSSIRETSVSNRSRTGGGLSFGK